MTRIGWGSLVIGALLCTPLADLLPLELWVHLKQLLSGTSHGSSHLYMRVTSTPETSVDPFKLVGAVLIVLGLLLVAAGHRMRSRH
ncbi:hypothetical protein [Rhizobacter sp. SG703]|uniref:hypothetical protein n=1 Tax=Rhizobacter sp. SG703 TaxID=2587140 RepID=UPI00144773BC|nr:hypothetical protein [Rhizobacter sp. SG703]NKI94715.1 hypothetical protein [Rhizobacter sp. SG703]